MALLAGMAEKQLLLITIATVAVCVTVLGIGIGYGKLKHSQIIEETREIKEKLRELPKLGKKIVELEDLIVGGQCFLRSVELAQRQRLVQSTPYVCFIRSDNSLEQSQCFLCSILHQSDAAQQESSVWCPHLVRCLGREFLQTLQHLICG